MKSEKKMFEELEAVSKRLKKWDRRYERDKKLF